MPTLYTSSFDADTALREPPPRTADKVIVGFREQTAAVAAVGITALLERVAVEGTSTVIEGAHVVPGFYDPTPYADRILAVPVVVTVEDEETHRSHFVARRRLGAARTSGTWPRSRTSGRSSATSRARPCRTACRSFPTTGCDRTLAAIIDLVMDRASERLGEPAVAARPPPSRP